jgi:hypothetical protein
LSIKRGLGMLIAGIGIIFIVLSVVVGVGLVGLMER